MHEWSAFNNLGEKKVLYCGPNKVLLLLKSVLLLLLSYFCPNIRCFDINSAFFCHTFMVFGLWVNTFVSLYVFIESAHCAIAENPLPGGLETSG